MKSYIINMNAVITYKDILIKPVEVYRPNIQIKKESLKLSSLTDFPELAMNKNIKTNN